MYVAQSKYKYIVRLINHGWLNYLMVFYMEREMFKSGDLDEIKKYFQMERRALLLHWGF